jgi:predicted phage-related endonuclease
MKITKRQLRRIIREEKARVLSERMDRSEMFNLESGLRSAVVGFVDEYMMKMGMNPSDPTDMKRLRREVDNIVNGVLG